MTRDEFRNTAVSILRKNLGILSILGLFPFVVGLIVHDGTLVPYTNWLLVISVAILFPGLYFSILLIVATLQNVADSRRERAGSVTFPGAIGWRLLLLGVVVLSAGLDIAGYRQDGRLGTTDVVFTFAMCLVAFAGWPRTIAFSGGAILQKKMFGGVKSIPFSDILTAKFDAQQHCIIVVGKNGVKVVHSMFHAGRTQFARQLELLTGVRVSGLSA